MPKKCSKFYDVILFVQHVVQHAIFVIITQFIFFSILTVKLPRKLQIPDYKLPANTHEIDLNDTVLVQIQY